MGIILFLGIAHEIFCQDKSMHLHPISIPKLDTTFYAVVENHLYEMKTKGLYDQVDTFIVIHIQPIISTTYGIPQTIIDSIYRKNIFPLTQGSSSYKLVVMSLESNCRAFNLIRCYKYQYLSMIHHNNILIVSDLNIEFINAASELSLLVCSDDPCDKLCQEKFNKVTTYILHDDEIIQMKLKNIWLRNNTLINHPGD